MMVRKMDNNLMETMKNISLLTIELIKIVESDDYSNLQNTLLKRQQALDYLGKMGCTKEEYKKAEEEFQINYIQEKLFKAIENRKAEIKEKLSEISTNKNVVKSYYHNNLTSSKIFSKKI